MPKRDAAHMSDQRQLILETALNSLAQDGLQALSMRKIAARAGLSNGALYVHFRSKRDILLGLLDETPRLWRERIFVSFDEFRAFLLSLADISAHSTAPMAQLNLHLLQLGTDDPEIARLITQTMQARCDMLVGHLERFQSSGAISAQCDILHEAQTIDMLLQGFHLAVLFVPDRARATIKYELTRRLDRFVTNNSK